MIHTKHGFTIVELVIVIAVIGILAAVVLLSWRGVLTASRDDARANDVKQWAATFDLYKSRFVVWPALPTADGDTNAIRLCLGQSGFQSSSDHPDYNGYCGQYKKTGSSRLAASDSASLITEIKRIGKEPVNGGSSAKGAGLGPFVYITRSTSAGTVTVTGWFVSYFEVGATADCPADLRETLPTASSFTSLTNGLPSGVTACGMRKTFSYTPS